MSKIQYTEMQQLLGWMDSHNSRLLKQFCPVPKVKRAKKPSHTARRNVTKVRGGKERRKLYRSVSKARDMLAMEALIDQGWTRLPGGWMMTPMERVSWWEFLFGWIHP